MCSGKWLCKYQFHTSSSLAIRCNLSSDRRANLMWQHNMQAWAFFMFRALLAIFRVRSVLKYAWERGGNVTTRQWFEARSFFLLSMPAGRVCGCIQNETVAISYHQHEWDVVLFVCVCTDSHCYDGWDRVSASWTEGSADATWDTLSCDLTGSLHLGHFISQFLWFGDLFPSVQYWVSEAQVVIRLYVRRVKHTLYEKIKKYYMQECIHLVNGN